MRSSYEFVCTVSVFVKIEYIVNPPKPVEQKRLTGRSATRDAGGPKLPNPVVVLAASSTVPKPPGSLGLGVRCGGVCGLLVRRGCRLRLTGMC